MFLLGILSIQSMRNQTRSTK